MLINNVSVINNYNIRNNSFKGKTFNFNEYLNSPELKDKIQEVTANPETKDLFNKLTTLASGFLASVVLYTQQNPQAKECLQKCLEAFGIETNKEKENYVSETHKSELDVDAEIALLIHNNPMREYYYDITSEFPNLNKEYKNRLAKLITEPNNENNKTIVTVLEKIFETLLSDGTQKTTRSYFESIDKNYADCLDELTMNATSAMKVDNSLFKYLVLLNNEKISKDGIKRWAKFSNLGCDEFMYLKNYLNDEQLSKLNTLKENKEFNISYFCDLDTNNNDYSFQLQFKDDVPVENMLQDIIQVHKIIYGSVGLSQKKDITQFNIENDIKTEMIDCIIKDIHLHASLNFIRFANPEAFKNLNIDSKELYNITKEDERYQQIKKICADEILNMNFNSPQMQAYKKLFNEQNSNDNLFTSRHAKLRFINRFVLKENIKPSELEEVYNEKVALFKAELKQNLSNTTIFRYKVSGGFAPQFYNYPSQLGSYVKVTLNDNGTINTLFEDLKKTRKL